MRTEYNHRGKHSVLGVTSGLLVLLLVVAATITSTVQRVEADPVDPPGHPRPITFDFDNDGAPDRLAASVSFSQSADACSMVQLYSGAFTEFRLAFVGAQPNDLFGYALSSAGDVNADGIEDIIIGAPRNNTGGANAGAVYLFSGANGGLLYSVNGTPGSYLGTTVAGVGDINGDSTPDLLVAGFDSSDLFNVTGVVWALSGVDGTPIRVFMPDDSDESFGHSLLGLGDLDSDGFNEVLIVAPYSRNSDSTKGKAYIFAGSISGPAADTVFSGDAISVIANNDPDVTIFGHLVTLGLDIDGDGKREVVIASRMHGAAEGVYSLAAVDTVSRDEIATSPDFQMIHPGDATGDQQTDLDDLTLTIANYGGSTDIQTIFDGDLNGDGVVDENDLDPVLDAFGTKSELQQLAGSIGVTVAQLGRYSIGVEDDGAMAYLAAGHPAPLTIHSLPGLPLGFACIKGRSPGRPLIDPHAAGHGGLDLCGGGGGPIIPDPDPELPNGDRDHDGIPNKFDCDEPEYEGDPLVDCECQDDDDDGMKNQDDCDSECFESGTDLDIDSNNDDGHASPDRSGAEDEVEDIIGSIQTPGKLLQTSTGDRDDDGVPDFADGITTHNNIGEGSCYPFTPLILSFSEELLSDECATDLSVVVTYSASDPSVVLKQVDEYGAPYYSPAPGALRLWRKSADQSRNATVIQDGGDYLPPGTHISVQSIGSGHTFIMFVEAIRPSASIADQSITVQLYANGVPIGESDVVRLTAIPRISLGFRNVEVLSYLGLPLAPVYTDSTSALGPEYAGLLLGNSALQVGLDGPHPNAEQSIAVDRECLGIILSGSEAQYLATSEMISVITADQDPDSTYWNLSLGLMSPHAQFPATADPEYPDWNDNASGELDPDGFEAAFETFILEKYSDAVPSIDWLELEAFELRGLVYGGRSWEWLSARKVWRSGNSIYVEDSLSPEEAADAYYEYLLDSFGPDAGGISTVPYLRYCGELYNLVEDGSRDRIGEYMARHWGLVDELTSDVTAEYYTIGAGFVLESVLETRRAKQVRFTPERPYAAPLVRRNFVRGQWVEHDTIVSSLGKFKYNGGVISVDVPSLGEIKFKPDGLYPTALCEIKDVITLSRLKQLRAEAQYAAQHGLRFVLVCTNRTKRISGPLLRLIREHPQATLVKRSVNSDQYQIFEFVAGGPPYSGSWIDVSKADVQALLSN